MHPVLNVSSQFEGNVNVTNGLNNPSGCDFERIAPPGGCLGFPALALEVTSY